VNVAGAVIEIGTFLVKACNMPGGTKDYQLTTGKRGTNNKIVGSFKGQYLPASDREKRKTKYAGTEKTLRNSSPFFSFPRLRLECISMAAFEQSHSTTNQFI